MTTVNCITDCPPLPQIEGIEIRHSPGLLGYAVGNDGSAWSCRPRGNRWKHILWRRLSPGYGPGGYRQIVICNGTGKKKSKRVASLVCEAFYGPRPSGMVVCHTDGSRANDTAANLRWDTAKANTGDGLRHGTLACLRRGETHPSAKLSNGDVDTIRQLGKYLKYYEIASIYGISKSHTRAILYRKERISNARDD